MSKDLAKPLVESILAGKIGLREAIKALERECFYQALMRTYGNSTAASDLLGVSPFVLQKYKQEAPDIEWPQKPDPHAGKVRLQSKKPLTDEDFLPTRIRETELDGS